MPYLVNEIFYTIQGEGALSGTAAVFCRFSRCNLWSGREDDRASAICKFCDTDFTHADKYTMDELVDAIDAAYVGSTYFADPLVVFTGGEPALQLKRELVQRLQDYGYRVAIETNGTIDVAGLELDWVCVSPKANAVLAVSRADELKLVYPQPDLLPDHPRIAYFDADHKWVSPMDGPNLAENTASAIEYVKANPDWRLNTQTHKQIGIR